MDGYDVLAYLKNLKMIFSCGPDGVFNSILSRCAEPFVVLLLYYIIFRLRMDISLNFGSGHILYCFLNLEINLIYQISRVLPNLVLYPNCFRN